MNNYLETKTDEKSTKLAKIYLTVNSFTKAAEK